MPSLLDALKDREFLKAVYQGLTDAANRGMVAGTLGAPVDMATQAANLGIAGAGYLGHKTGLLSTPPELIDSRNVPGSSEWIGQKMQNVGAVSANRNPVAEAGMGLLSPVAFKVAQKAGGLLANVEMRAAENAAKPSTLRQAKQRGIFAGEWAQTADKDKLMAAQSMEAKKADPRDIWNQTGWFKGPDGKWRFEIDDSASLVKSGALPEREFFASGQSLGRHADFKLSDALDHSRLFDAYPDAGKVQMSFTGENNGLGANYKPGFDWISMGTAYKEPAMSPAGQSAVSALSAELNAIRTSPRQTRYDALTDAILDRNGENFVDPRLIKVTERFGAPLEVKKRGLMEQIAKAKESMSTGTRVADFGRSPLLHEVQHAIQEREGFAKGGAPEDNAYRRLMGEVEARAVQSRMNLSAEQRRALFPLDSYDVPLDSLIIKY